MASFELTSAHKDFLLRYCGDYDRSSPAERAIVRKKAKKEFIDHFHITDKVHLQEVDTVSHKVFFVVWYLLTMF